MNKNSDWDLDLEFGKKFEQKLKSLLESKGKIEVKTERDTWKRTGNIVIEIRGRNDRESGISVTKADWRFHILSYEGDVKGMICLPVDKLKRICKEMVKKKVARVTMGGDDGVTQIILIPINKILEYV